MDGTTSSPASVASLIWSVGQKVRATIILKVAFSYTLSGELVRLRAPHIHRADQLSKDELSIVALCELAPFIRSPEVIVVGKAHGEGEVVRAGLRVERDGEVLIDKSLEVPRGAEVAGLGPVGRAWPFSVDELQRSYVTIPPGLDGACFQRAAADQAVVQLRGGERIRLLDLHANHPTVELQPKLPAVHAQVVMAGRPNVVPLVPDAYLIDCEQRQLHVLWRGSVPVERIEALADAIIETHVEGFEESPSSSEEEATPSTIAFAATTGGAKTAPTGYVDVSSAKTLPFVGPRGGARTQDAPPIEGAPWSPVEAKPIPAAAGVHRTLSLEELRTLNTADVDAALASRSGVAPSADAPPGPPAAAPEPKEPAAAPEPKPVKWREDPPEKLPPPEPPKPAPPPRRNLNAGLYSFGDKRKKR